MPESHSTAAVLATLGPLPRLALAYSPRAARRAWLSFLALDARLAKVVREAREPMIGQIRLAWWRERLCEPTDAWPAGEPLLALLREWDRDHSGLATMVDGWEVLLAEPPLSGDSVAAAVAGRAAGAVALAQHLGQGQYATEVERIARGWAATDFAAGMRDASEADAFREQAPPRKAAALPRALRPLAVLEALTRSSGPGSVRLAAAVRIGIFGR